jgi:hypothetical protein
MQLKYTSIQLLALVLGLSATQLACAQAKNSNAKPGSSTTVKTDPETKSLMKFSQTGHDAIQAIRGARVAIFDGDTAAAKKLMDKAKTYIAAAEKEAPLFTTQTTMSVQGKVVDTETGKVRAQSVPVDGQVVLADNFVVTPEKQAHIAKANEHFQKGNHKEAMEELRQGEIDVNYSRVWMPLAKSQSSLDKAIQLAGAGKYYESNLALKSIEDGLTVDSVMLTEPAKTTPAKKS